MYVPKFFSHYRSSFSPICVPFLLVKFFSFELLLYILCTRQNIIDTDFSLDQMIDAFSSKGLSIQDLVVLSGAHTIGASHCNAFNGRFKQDSKGSFELIDASLDKSYAKTLMNKCSSSESSSLTVSNDPETSSTFDNQYYRNQETHKGLFQTDSALMEDDRTRKMVEALKTFLLCN
ncbi:PREDICTED: peroxidase 46-like [Camelina sativa]|uniref:peroxidase n=1 Tax=Camelina sativa TaxID=90675 RepID=A0ABM0TXM0_CAMSA|nr:PREDICTED: peroxidase 46-like [Camelina sativa]